MKTIDKATIGTFFSSPELVSIQLDELLSKKGGLTKMKLCELLTITRPTLDKRLCDHTWTYSEVEFLLIHDYIR